MAGGKVYLIGAGPGDIGLLTVQGKWYLEHADAVVYDRLVSSQLLTLTKRDSELYDVGKSALTHKISQLDINALLIELAQRGLTVVRLKGGDPFVFGRGGEEALALSDAGVSWEVVPGVTSAAAVCAYAGIPVTHRAWSSSLTVVTGHGSHSAPDVDWRHLSKIQGTLVVLMGVSSLSFIVKELTDGGMPVDTPVAVIQWGTRAAQRTAVAELKNIREVIAKEQLKSPSVIVLGKVVELRERLAWLETRPLHGKSVIVAADTRQEAASMAESVQGMGAETFAISLEQLVYFNNEVLDRVLEQALSTSAPVGIYFRSSLGVDCFFSRCKTKRLDLRRFSGVSFFATNARVAARIECYGIYGIHVGCFSVSWFKNPPLAAVWVETDSGIVKAAGRFTENSNNHSSDNHADSSTLKNDASLAQVNRFAPFEFRAMSHLLSVVKSWSQDHQPEIIWYTTGARRVVDLVFTEQTDNSSTASEEVSQTALPLHLSVDNAGFWCTSVSAEHVVEQIRRQSSGVQSVTKTDFTSELPVHLK